MSNFNNIVEDGVGKPYNMENRLVEFAADALIFSSTIEDSYEGIYYKKQLVRSTGSAALNYGEAQGTQTTRDFVHKSAIVVKELKESRINLKILAKVNFGFQIKRNELLDEVEQLIAIISKMINNKK
jgi:four helix bundle protein